MPKTILVTGSAGFIGFHTACQLLREGHRVIGVDNLNHYYDPRLKKSRNIILRKDKNYSFYQTDLADYRKMEQIFRKYKIDQICHLGAQAGVRYSLENPFVYLKSNIDGTLNIFELARKYQVSEVVFSSSSSVYGDTQKVPFSETDRVDNPISLYAATKKSDELIAHVYHKLFKIKVIGLRFFTVYGPWGRPDMAIFGFTQKILNNKPIEIFNKGNMLRDFTYIDDIVSGISAALKIVASTKYEIINLGNNRPEKLNTMIDLLEKYLERKAVKKYLPLQPGDMVKTCADIRKAKKLLGYQPKTKLAEGLKEFIDWYLDFYKI